MELTSGQLTAFIKRGELVLVESFEAWYGREHDRMIATLLLTTGSLELAIEGTDEACSRALERWDRVGVMEAPSGWVYRVAINHARRIARRRRYEERVFRKTEEPTQLPPHASEIWDLVASLSERQRQVVILRHVAQFKEAEIGEVLRISRGTVSSTLHDAHQRLGRLLSDGNEI
jgi:RNA polymerase sigma-70 factor (ECF subfamily)